MTTYKAIVFSKRHNYLSTNRNMCKYINRYDIPTKHRKWRVGDNRRGVHIQLHAKSAGLLKVKDINWFCKDYMLSMMINQFIK